MRFGSLCSGIEAASQAWHVLGWKAQFFAEIENFPSAVLAHHYPDVPNYGDMTKFAEWPDAAIDLLVGGTPCQSFSVAGLLAGLADPRGNLMLTYLAVAAKYRPRWVVWENVPGVLSSNGGRDFGAFLRGLVELGYGFAYRVLDAQYVRVGGFPRAVPQRRRRVFVVGYLGDWRRAAAVLFDGESLRGNPAPRREAGKGIAPAISARPTGGGGLGTDFDLDGGLLAFGYGNTDGLIKVAAPFVQPIPFDTTQVTSAVNRSAPEAGDSCHPLAAEAHAPAIAFAHQAGGDQTTLGYYPSAGAAPTLGSHQTLGVHYGWAVRRLTPRECERLQGFPDDFTLIPFRGKPAADGPRYKALGNSMAVNCMRWIGERIAMVDAVPAIVEGVAA